ncbi:MAG: peptidoglycan DD-metalloendopeptidase family protein [Candidatus Aerophobetes bacterium]|nr:peptidoglycan DD-metalloendopeptidase family protein [Candidatus Aerophobetes bacterium]
MSPKTRKFFFYAAICGAIIVFILYYSPLSSHLSILSTSSEKLAEKSAKTSINTVPLTTVRYGQTVYESLLSAGISPQTVHLINQKLKPLFNLKRCRPGDSFELKESGDGNLIFKYFPNSLEYYIVEESPKGTFSARKEKIPLKRVLVGAKANIRSSVYESMRNEGVSPQLINRFTDIFSWDIDFFTEPRRGDTIKLIWERYLSLEGKIIKEGKILSAQYINAKRDLTAIFFQDKDGHSDYYTPQGNSLRKSFLRSPLKYSRISSYFSYHRFHPILRIYRPHLGIDYAAPPGTPVSAIAEGRVIFKGWKGGFGNFIKIKHSHGITSSYGHLYRFARSLRRGKKVEQGQVIGYVGSTGLSTGPHLDFRITKQGRYVNFLKTEFPRAEPVNSAYLNEFKKVSQKYLNHLSTLSDSPENIYPVRKTGPSNGVYTFPQGQIKVGDEKSLRSPPLFLPFLFSGFLILTLFITKKR